MKHYLTALCMATVISVSGQQQAAPSYANAWEFQSFRSYTSNDPSLNDKSIPAFSMKTPEGGVIKSQDLKGKIVVLDFWSTWCGPCRIITNQLDSMLKKYSGNPRFQMIGVNYLESEMARNNDPVKYWKEHGYSFPMTINNDAFGKSLNAGNPTVIVLDGNGVIKGKWDALTPTVTTEVETLVWAMLENASFGIGEIRDALRQKEYVKTVFMCDVYLKKFPEKLPSLVSEKFLALLNVSEFDALDFIKPIIDATKDSSELDRLLTNTSFDIVESPAVQAPDLFKYATECLQRLINELNAGKDFIVYDHLGRGYMKLGKRKEALTAAEKAVELAKQANASNETMEYLQSMVSKYQKEPAGS